MVGEIPTQLGPLLIIIGEPTGQIQDERGAAVGSHDMHKMHLDAGLFAGSSEGLLL